MIISIKSVDENCEDFQCIYLCTKLTPEQAVHEINEIYLDDIIHKYGEKATDTENPFNFKNIFFN